MTINGTEASVVAAGSWSVLSDAQKLEVLWEQIGRIQEELSWTETEFHASESDHSEESHIAWLRSERDTYKQQFEAANAKLNAPELHDFASGVVLEAAHQRERWPSEHDSGKAPSDWFWLIGYLAGKALAAHASGNTEKALHHTISTAAALNNWHASILGASSVMRPGISTPTKANNEPERA